MKKRHVFVQSGVLGKAAVMVQHCQSPESVCLMGLQDLMKSVLGTHSSSKNPVLLKRPVNNHSSILMQCIN